MSDIEAWLRGIPGFERASVVALEPRDGYSNTNSYVRLRNAPVEAAVLRQQPEHGIFEPYDVLREGRVIQALANTAIPVPEVLASEAGEEPFGAPVLLLEWIDAPHLGAVPPEELGAGLPAFFSMVTAIHDLDWESAGLGLLGVPDGPGEAFQSEVELVATRMTGFGAEGEPLLVDALAALRAIQPSGGELALCHGDVNIFNFLYRDGEIVGVVDWEQARISDPRSDMGQLDALSLLKGLPWSPARDMAPFRAFWLFQLAVIHRGLERHTDIDPWYSWPDVTGLLSLALDEL